ncbi:MAG: class I SAM-dependent methyltransferase [Alphaproteobacteria bacterium]|nr:class I SAM-dependent methyltransferase [Alphaproteobacteria bacterium]
MAENADDARVTAQYEALPYPARDPADEAKRLILGAPSHLFELNHYVFAGGRDFRLPFRALVAGGGTGDGLIMLAQQLADLGTPSEVTYLDVSTAARRVAEARAKARELTNIRFLSGSLLDLAALAPGPYDYIDCCGVLHHLADPAGGLVALAGELAPAGGMGLMLYGRLGRTGVYETQAALRRLAPETLPVAERIATARRLLKALPATNWLRRNPFVADHLDGGEAGLHDLLLHARDRAYDVAELAALVEGAGLAIAAFIAPARYDPASYVADPTLRRQFQGLAWLERSAMAERLAGNIRKHVVYAVPKARAGLAVAKVDSPATVPLFRQGDGPRWVETARKGSVTADLDGVKLTLPLPRLAAAIVARIDGRRSLAVIHADLQSANPRLGWDIFKAEFDALYAALNAINELLLRVPSEL